MPILSQRLRGFLEGARRMKGVSLLEHYAIPARHREQAAIPTRAPSHARSGCRASGCPSPKRRSTVRLAREHPRPAAKTLSLVGGRATAIFRQAA
jgi:hypothetical protein